MKKLVYTLVFLIVILSLGLAAFTTLQLLAPVDPTAVEKKIITVEKGAPPKKISRELHALGLIRNADIFYWYGKLTGKWPLLKAGEYDLSASLSSEDVFKKLMSGLGLQRVLLVKEGLNIYEIGDLIEQQGISTKQKFIARISDAAFIATLGLPSALPAPKNLEGYLHPDTYYFTKTTSLDDLLRMMLKRFSESFNETINPVVQKSSDPSGLRAEELIILASMVEKETGAPEERPLIAGVFYNRLKKGMKLQSDPTTIYGIWSRYKGNIRRADLLESTPYNTYTVPALPAGPIANPGREAMKAVVEPATHEYLYFVSKNDGTHLFSKTYEDHQKAVTAFQMNAAAREGKSWRDLNKKR